MTREIQCEAHFLIAGMICDPRGLAGVEAKRRVKLILNADRPIDLSRYLCTFASPSPPVGWSTGGPADLAAQVGWSTGGPPDLAAQLHLATAPLRLLLEITSAIVP